MKRSYIFCFERIQRYTDNIHSIQRCTERIQEYPDLAFAEHLAAYTQLYPAPSLPTTLVELLQGEKITDGILEYPRKSKNILEYAKVCRVTY